MHEIDGKLNFQSPVVLVGGGELQVSALHLLIENGWSVVAADGGANRLRSLGIMPAAIVGDLDSLQDAVYWNKHTRVLHVAEQDSTDFEKCLYTVKAPLIAAVGFTGRRFDHTLVTLHLMLKYSQTRLLLVTGEDVCFAWQGDLQLALPADQRFSIYPLTATDFKGSVGLEFSLQGLRLEQGQLIGTSNRVVAGHLEITADPEGVYLVIVARDQMAALVSQIGDNKSA